MYLLSSKKAVYLRKRRRAPDMQGNFISSSFLTAHSGKDSKYSEWRYIDIGIVFELIFMQRTEYK